MHDEAQVVRNVRNGEKNGDGRWMWKAPLEATDHTST